jgi:hypothetical protein
MAVPKGRIVDRPMMARACGCLCEFQTYEVDKYRAERLAKFQQTRCPACVAKLQDEQRLAVAARPPRGEALRVLPIGTQMMVVRRPDGLWAGTLAADGAQVEAVADSPRPLVATLAQLWSVATSHVLTGSEPTS